MGMYTELVLKCEISAEAPKVVKDVLLHMFGGKPRPDDLPDHDFFKCHRWDFLGSCSSFYHHPDVINSIPAFEFTDCFYIFSRSDIKNYDSEIEKFVEWVTPYIEGAGEVCIGWKWYEEEEKPTLIIINKGEEK